MGGHILAFLTWQQFRTVLPIGLVGLISWSVWMIRNFLSMLYRPVPPGYQTTTSVVVPSFHEDPAILARCLESWVAESPSEVVIVPDLADTEVISYLQQIAGPRLRVVPIQHDGKRSALAAGIRAARSEIVVLTDSDTEWTPGMLANIIAPFKDPKVGGVGSRQNVYQPETNIWRRVADWMIDIRYLSYVPSQGRAGAVACLSGRTAAYRRAVVMPVLGNLEHEFFLGRRCISGDDGRLTWLVLASGYKTVHQSSARTVSMFPEGMRPFLKQRLRWSRNSYRCYITAMWKGWLWRTPFITRLSVLQVMLTPLTMGIAMSYLVMAFVHRQPILVSIALAWLLVGRSLRGVPHLFRRPGDLFILPLVVMMTVYVALVVKSYAFLTMNRQGWLTRGDFTGGEGQTARTLRGAPSNG
jgi:cellulose synthase/poly-beta-1,6-N-acetylglucosamine synthase-like glycosyltransferase